MGSKGRCKLKVPIFYPLQTKGIPDGQAVSIEKIFLDNYPFTHMFENPFTLMKD